MTRVTFGNLRKIRHVLYETAPGESIREELRESVKEWCKDNMRGEVYIDWETYTKFSEEDQKTHTYGRFVFVFESDRDALLFKLFHFA